MMQVFHSLEQLKPLDRGSVITIGNFDGVHVGHREIFRRVVTRGRELGAETVVVTFVPHPLKVLTPQRAPRLLNTDTEKERLINASCIDRLICLPFDTSLAQLSARDFVRSILVDKLQVRHLVIGYDYAFGHNREGDARVLGQLGAEFGFEVETLRPVTAAGEVYSSTLIRRHLAAGDVAAVVPLLGRHFNLEGRVIRGFSRGRKLGFPTANLRTDKEILPRPGVYAVRAKLGDEFFDGVMNIGFNPTFGVERISLEVHLIDFDRDIYDEVLRVYFVSRLRDELVFSSVADLITRIGADITAARRVLDQTALIRYCEYLDCGTTP